MVNSLEPSTKVMGLANWISMLSNEAMVAPVTFSV